MRTFMLMVLAGTVLTAGAPAWAVQTATENLAVPVLRSTTHKTAGEPQAVKPGEMVTITGDCLTGAEDPQVVFALPDARQGYKAVLATEQREVSGALQVRVPDMPDIADRTFQVRVFLLGNAQPTVCHAGAVHVG